MLIFGKVVCNVLFAVLIAFNNRTNTAEFCRDAGRIGQGRARGFGLGGNDIFQSRGIDLLFLGVDDAFGNGFDTVCFWRFIGLNIGIVSSLNGSDILIRFDGQVVGRSLSALRFLGGWCCLGCIILRTCGCGSSGGRCHGCGLAQGRAQNDTAVFQTRINPTGDFAFCNTGQHFCVRCGRLCPEIAVFLREIAEVFRNSLHHLEGIVESLQGARKSAIAYC